MKRNRLALLALAAVTAGSALAAASPALATATAASPQARTGHWGNARHVPGLDKLNTGNDAVVTNVSCPKPGNCTAAGRYFDGSELQSFVVTETNGAWGNATRLLLPDPAAVHSTLLSLSCGGAGNCVAVGLYGTASVTAGFYTVEDHGDWVSSTSTSGGTTFSQASAVSCTRGDNCAVGGSQFDHSTTPSGPDQPFLVDEKSGAWGLPQPVSGLRVLHAVQGIVDSVSCASPGDCAVLGSYLDDANKSQLFVADERAGGWGQAQQLPGTAALGDLAFGAGTLSCAAAAHCAAGGVYEVTPGNEQLLVSDEVNGSWQPARQVRIPVGKNELVQTFVNEMSCAAAGSCVAVGSYISDGTSHALVVEEKHGSWQALPGLGGTGPGSDAGSVSCAAAGNCVVAGDAVFGKAAQPFTLTEVNGHWGKAVMLPGIAALDKGDSTLTLGVSCATTGNCAVGGQYEDAQSNSHAFLASEATATSTKLGLSAASIRFGHEQGEKISVKVIPQTGGIPGGTVTVRASTGARTATACVITLAGGKGTCRLAARALTQGRHQLTAVYRGSQTYAGSAAGGKTLTVTR